MQGEPPRSWLDTIRDHLESMPAWARPPFYGMLLVYGMMLTRRGGLALLVVLLAVVLGGPEAALQLCWIVVAAGVAGFAGGLAYALVHPLLRRLGRLGAVVTGWCAVFAYLVTVLPLVSRGETRPSRSFDPSDPVSWWIVAALSVLFGSVLGAIFMDPGQKPKRPERVGREQKVTSRVHPPAG